MTYQQLFPLLSHHDSITRATLATSEIQDEFQDIASDIQGHSWTGTYPYHEFDFSKEKIPIALEVKRVFLGSTFLQVEKDVGRQSLFRGCTHVMEKLPQNIRHETNTLKFMKDIKTSLFSEAYQ